MGIFPPWSGPGHGAAQAGGVLRGAGPDREALDALDRAKTAPEEYPDRTLCMEICGLVRRRLENPGYLRDPDYGAALMDVFHRCRRELPIGYAGFHLPWVLEWLTAGRQYKLAYELVREFPLAPGEAHDSGGALF